MESRQAGVWFFVGFLFVFLRKLLSWGFAKHSCVRRTQVSNQDRKELFCFLLSKDTRR